MKARLALAAALLAGVLAIGFTGNQPGDVAAAAFVNEHYHPVVDGPVAFLGAVGDPFIALATVALLALQLRRTHGTHTALTAVAAAAVVLPNALLKQLFGPSPFLPGNTELHLHVPSGHVAYATAFFGLLALLAHRAGRRDLTLAAAAVVVLMGPARLLAGVHVLSDVVAGHLVGLAWLLALSALPGELRPRW